MDDLSLASPEAEPQNHTTEELFPLVYDELRRLAHASLAAEPPGQTLQTTALVNEAYLRLVGVDGGQRWNNRGHFFAAAAEAMRRILVESARRKGRKKHGGDRHRVDLDEGLAVTEAPEDDLLALHEALDLLANEDPGKAELVKLRYFAGLTVAQAAELLGISVATAERHWTFAKVWLYDKLQDEEHG